MLSPALYLLIWCAGFLVFLSDESGKVVSSCDDIKQGDKIEIYLSDGSASASIDEVIKSKQEKLYGCWKHRNCLQKFK